MGMPGVLVPLQHLSSVFKNADLKVVQVDAAAFKAAENDIFAAADAEARNPTHVPIGVLRQHVETKNGHTITKFYGRPMSWMHPMMPRGRLVTQISKADSDSAKGQILYKRG
jgi:hypothetical protein